ncbi:MAG: polysaccharide deacetylase family protein, partial [Bacteroidota bacterium]
FARDQVESDLERSLSAIEDCTGVRPKFYRPPYGRLHPAHRDLPAAHGCALVLWNALPGDFDQQVTVDELRRRIEIIREGDIVVLHDHAHALDRTTACISFIGDLLRRTGIRAVSLS